MPASIIENDAFRLEANSLGGELRSIYSKKSGREYLWQGDPRFWAERAPILFPVVGRLNGGEYRVDGITYKLPIHGFARRKEFVSNVFLDGSDGLIKTDDKNNRSVKITGGTAGVRYSISDDDETRAVYPYRFRLEIEHSLTGNAVKTTFAVRNANEGQMWFCIGGHPGINCPFAPGEAFEDYYLEFNKPERAERLIVGRESLLFTGERTPFLNGAAKIPLDYGLFADDAICLSGLRSTTVSLKSIKSSGCVSFDFKGFPVLAFWTKPDADYICLEPWFGHGDTEGYDGELKDKPWAVKLDSGEVFNCSYTITVNE